MQRRSTVLRDTNETQIKVELNLDGTGESKLDSGVPFLDHMLDQIARHGCMDLSVEANGDTFIDDHHSVEDVGITLGQALTKALGSKQGITRFASAYVPLDEALSRVTIDISGRPGLYFECDFTAEKIGQFDTQLVFEFFQGFVNHAQLTLHIDNLKGRNAHHQVESIFKAFARALRTAVMQDPTLGNHVPSTKGAL